jgi:hypothetical protein
MSEEKNTTANRPVSASPAGFENVIGCFRKMLYATNETQVGPRPQDLDARSCVSVVCLVFSVSIARRYPLSPFERRDLEGRR